MAVKSFCNCCNGNQVDIYNDRELSWHNDGYYTGFEVFIEDNKLKVFACLDNHNIRPVSSEVAIDINFCPICGRKLKCVSGGG